MTLKHHLLTRALGAILLPGLCMCSGNSNTTDTTDYSSVGEVADTLTFHAKYLTIADLGNGTVRVDIADPWNEGATLGRYALVDRDSTIPEGLPTDINIIRTPVERAAVYSSVHTGGLAELEALECLKAVADGAYFPPADTVAALLKTGKLIDVGKSESPSTEKLAASRAEIVLRSPMQGLNSGTLPENMVAVECADYLEPTPIGRAEWILLLGELSGRRDEARQILTDVIDNYTDLVFKATTAKSPRPKVLTETEQSGVWYVPAGQSYQARMLTDAGAFYPWGAEEGTGSLPLSLEKVAERAIDADVWLVRGYRYTPSAKTLVAQNPRYAAFKAVKDGNVYGCDTAERPIFNDIAFHPDRILADYVAIFHPDAMPDYELKYYNK